MKPSDIINEAGKFGTRFQKWIEFILKWECEYSKNGNILIEDVHGDAGGTTFAGIDKRSHPNFNYSNPSAHEVARIYHDEYWMPAKADALGFPVGEVVANYAVNMGLRPAVKMLQTAINILPGRGDTVVDGVIGPQTIHAAQEEDGNKLADMIEDEADERYRNIVAARPSQRKFLQGWLNRNNALEKWWQTLA